MSRGSRANPIDHGPIMIEGKEYRIWEIFDTRYAVVDPDNDRAVAVPGAKSPADVREAVSAGRMK